MITRVVSPDEPRFTGTGGFVTGDFDLWVVAFHQNGSRKGCALITQFTHRGDSRSSVRFSHGMARKHSHGERNVIGLRIRKLRLNHKPPISQEDLAARLAIRGVIFDRSAISRIEAQRRALRDYEILAISDALRVSVAALFGET